MIAPRTDHLIDLALEEDAGLGDVTSRAIFAAKHRSRGFIDAKQDLVICGVGVANAIPVVFSAGGHIQPSGLFTYYVKRPRAPKL